MSFLIRNIKISEYPLLKDFLYEAVFQPNEEKLLPKSIVENNDMKLYIKDFGAKTDNCLVVECEHKVVGAVWARIFCGVEKGYGTVSDDIPEVSISLFKEYRNKGIGTELMVEMLRLLKKQGFEKASLSVQKNNYASKLYTKLGFKVYSETENEYVMIIDLNKQERKLNK